MDALGVGDDVMVGQHVAVGADHHARAEPAFTARRVLVAEPPAEELAERLRDVGGRRGGPLLDADGRDGGRHPIDDAAVGLPGR